MTWTVTVEFEEREEAVAFFDMVGASRQDLVPLVWRGSGTALKYAALRSATGVKLARSSDH